MCCVQGTFSTSNEIVIGYTATIRNSSTTTLYTPTTITPYSGSTVNLSGTLSGFIKSVTCTIDSSGQYYILLPLKILVDKPPGTYLVTVKTDQMSMTMGVFFYKPNIYIYNVDQLNTDESITLSHYPDELGILKNGITFFYNFIMNG